MELQKLDTCCSALHLNKASDLIDYNKEQFNKFLYDSNFNKRRIKSIIYLSNYDWVDRVKVWWKLGFVKKGSYNGENGRKVYILVKQL